MKFTTKEIIDIAVGIEETGYEFYREAMIKFKDSPVVEVFDFLAREELAHKELFQTLATGKNDEGIFTDEYYFYLKAIGGPRIFDRSAATASGALSGIDKPLGAVSYAFNAEKESILFYSEMKRIYREGSESVNILDTIIEEERKHVLTLADLSEKIRLTV